MADLPNQKQFDKFKEIYFSGYENYNDYLADLINTSMYWEDTPQGWDYWHNIFMKINVHTLSEKSWNGLWREIEKLAKIVGADFSIQNKELQILNDPKYMDLFE